MTARWSFLPTPEQVRCRCSHSPVVHEDRTGECWSVACGCRVVRLPSVEASKANHPAGKAIPSPEPIDRSVQ